MKKLVSLMLALLIAGSMSMFVYADDSLINVELPSFTGENVELGEVTVAG